MTSQITSKISRITADNIITDREIRDLDLSEAFKDSESLTEEEKKAILSFSQNTASGRFQFPGILGKKFAAQIIKKIPNDKILHNGIYLLEKVHEEADAGILIQSRPKTISKLKAIVTPTDEIKVLTTVDSGERTFRSEEVLKTIARIDGNVVRVPVKRPSGDQMGTQITEWKTAAVIDGDNIYPFIQVDSGDLIGTLKTRRSHYRAATICGNEIKITKTKDSRDISFTETVVTIGNVGSTTPITKKAGLVVALWKQGML